MKLIVVKCLQCGAKVLIENENGQIIRHIDEDEISRRPKPMKK